MRFIRTYGAALLFFIGLAACEPVPTTQAASRDVAAPGPELVGVSQAVKYFGDVCVDNAPKFADAGAELAAPTFQQDPSSKIYYHRKLNMSFKLVPEGGGLTCSMVFVSNASPEDLGRSLAVRTTRTGDISVNAETFEVSSDGPEGTSMSFFKSNQSNYYRAVLGRSK